MHSGIAFVSVRRRDRSTVGSRACGTSGSNLDTGVYDGGCARSNGHCQRFNSGRRRQTCRHCSQQIGSFGFKAGWVAALIRGKKAEEAMNILSFSKKAMAKDASKVLASAIANAENNHNLDVDALVVAEASVGKSITMKRFHTRGRGKSTRILKPFSKLRIVVREDEEA